MSTLSTKEIGLQLKKARQEKGLSQQYLSSLVGIPQSHLSKIESGLVNLRLSSLVELSRTLELEIMLVPRLLVRTVEGLQRGRQDNSEPSPLYQLEDEDEE